jgi:hypothetical protein
MQVPGIGSPDSFVIQSQMSQKAEIKSVFLSLVSIPSVVIIRNNGFKNSARP